MLLTIDSGNSQIVVGAFEDRELRRVWRLTTDPSKSVEDYGVQFSSFFANQKFNLQDISACIMSSVVPQLNSTFEIMVKSVFQLDLTLVTPNSPHGLILRYDNPSEIGTDRLVNAAAGFDRYHCDLIIVDFGTATTLCTITENGEYLGGVIAPGLKNSVESLSHQAAQLPMVDLVQPMKVIGTNTVEGMHSGAVFGHADLVDGLVTRIRAEIGKQAFVLATGGLASLITPISKTIQEVRPNLTLEGLELLYRRMSLISGG